MSSSIIENTQCEAKPNDAQAWYPAEIIDIIDNKFLVKYSNNMWKPETLAADRVRPSPHQSSKQQKQVPGDNVEVFTHTDENDPDGQWLATIKAAKGDFQFIHYEYHDSSYDEITEYEKIRPRNTRASQSLESLTRKGIKVHEILHEWALKERTTSFESYKSKCNAISFTQNEEDHEIIVLGSENACRRATLLLDTVFKHARDLNKITEFKKKKEIHLQKVKERLDTEVRVEFKVPSECVGLLVGSQYKNVKDLQNKQEVYINIEDVPDEKFALFKVTGDNESNVNFVTEKLKIVKHEYEFLAENIGSIIGKNGAKIKEIIEKAKLLKINIIDKDNMTKTILLYGSKMAVDDACLILDTQKEFIDLTNETKKQISITDNEIKKLQVNAGRIDYESNQKPEYNSNDKYNKNQKVDKSNQGNKNTQNYKQNNQYDKNNYKYGQNDNYYQKKDNKQQYKKLYQGESDYW